MEGPGRNFFFLILGVIWLLKMVVFFKPVGSHGYTKNILPYYLLHVREAQGHTHQGRFEGKPGYKSSCAFFFGRVVSDQDSFNAPNDRMSWSSIASGYEPVPWQQR